MAGMLRPLLREWLDANMPRLVDAALHGALKGEPTHASDAASMPAQDVAA